MQLSLGLVNSNEKTIDEIAVEYWGEEARILENPQEWPTNAIFVRAQENSGVLSVANAWIANGDNRRIFNAFGAIAESEILSLLVEAEQSKIFLLVFGACAPALIKVNSADLRSRISNMTLFDGLQPRKNILAAILRKWCHHYGVEIPKNSEKLILNEQIFDFVTLYKLVCLIKERYAPGSILSQDEMVGIILELERETKFL